MTCYNPKLDLVNMNAYIKFGGNIQVVLKILGRYEILAEIKGHNSGTNLRKIMCNNPKVDHVNINAHTKLSWIL